MACKAPERLDEEGIVRREYIEFMEKMPENRESMTDDEIYDWLISRRGGTKEEIMKCFGEDYFSGWLPWLRYSDDEKEDPNILSPLWRMKEIECKAIETILEYVNATGDDQGWDRREKFVEFFESRDWLGFGSEEAVFQDIYNGLIRSRLDYFRKEEDREKCDSLEFIYITGTGHGLDQEDWDKLQFWNKENNSDVDVKWIWHTYLIGGHNWV